MIVYSGHKIVDNVHFIGFKNETSEVFIPVDKRTLDQILAYLDKLQPSEPVLVERGNDEDSD